MSHSSAWTSWRVIEHQTRFLDLSSGSWAAIIVCDSPKFSLRHSSVLFHDVLGYHGAGEDGGERQVGQEEKEKEEAYGRGRRWKRQQPGQTQESGLFPLWWGCNCKLEKPLPLSFGFCPLSLSPCVSSVLVNYCMILNHWTISNLPWWNEATILQFWRFDVFCALLSLSLFLPMQPAFEMDLKDSRFDALYSAHDFALDPSNPQYK